MQSHRNCDSKNVMLNKYLRLIETYKKQTYKIETHLNCTTVGSSLCRNMQEDRWSSLYTSTLLESKLNYFPVPELMNQISGFSKLIAILIALPHFRAQNHTSYLNISVMVSCVLRNGWFSFSHTQFSSHHYSAHVVLSGYPRSHYSRVTRSHIRYIHYIKLYIWLPKFYRTPLLEHFMFMVLRVLTLGLLTWKIAVIDLRVNVEEYINIRCLDFLIDWLYDRLH